MNNMKNMKELVTLQNSVMLDEGNFGHWKFRMRHIIRGIDKDAWMTVEQGWAAHMMLMEDKKNMHLNQRRGRLALISLLSKFNSKVSKQRV